jgi:hypothetical protein
LLDTKASVKGVRSNPIRPDIEGNRLVSRVGGGSLRAGDLALTVGWGHPGKGGITMPGKGRIVEREYAPDEIEAIRHGVESLGLTLDNDLRLLGPTTRDIDLNNTRTGGTGSHKWEITRLGAIRSSRSGSEALRKASQLCVSCT